MTTEFMGYQVVLQDGTSMYRIKRKGSGPVPNSLKGLFTSKDTAFSTIASQDRIVTGRIRNGTKTRTKERSSSD